MLDIAVKLFERNISVRLEAAIEQVGGLYDNQFGFRKGRSTIDAINRVVSVAKNAVISSYLSNRTLFYDTDGTHSYTFTGALGARIPNLEHPVRWIA